MGPILRALLNLSIKMKLIGTNMFLFLLIVVLVERTGAGAGVWGIARWADHLVILIDLMEAAGTD